MALRAQSWRSGRGRTHEGGTRPYRDETHYHFRQPEGEAEANHWLQRFIDGYNARDHRHEPQSRADDWLANLPSDGARAMYRLLLAPDLVEAILGGWADQRVMLEALERPLPVGWEEQRRTIARSSSAMAYR